MKNYPVLLSVILFLFFLSLPLTAQDTGLLTEILLTIENIRNDPVSDFAQEEYARILKFAEIYDNVYIDLSEKKLPWFGKIDNQKWSAYLLGAYIAGNVKYQVEKGKAEDNPAAGTLFVIFVYNEIRKIDKEFLVPEIEHLITLNSENRLEDYFKEETQIEESGKE